MAGIMDGYQFWKQVDSLNPYGTASELSKQMGINYYAMKQWRADSRIPKAETLLQLSRALNKSIEFLLTGEDARPYSERVTKIANRCQLTATKEELFMVEKILGITPGAIVIDQEEMEDIDHKKRSASSGTA